MSETLSLPVVPLRNEVLFPGVVTPVRAGRPATMRAIQAAINNGDRRILAVLQLGVGDDVGADEVSPIGTICRIDQVQKVGTPPCHELLPRTHTLISSPPRR